jgi:hypothetical protein
MLSLLVVRAWPLRLEFSSRMVAGLAVPIIPARLNVRRLLPSAKLGALGLLCPRALPPYTGISCQMRRAM